MIYQYIKRYLKDTIDEPDIDFNWSALDNINFFSHIDKRYTLEEFAKNISEIKQAFKDFFEPIGKVVFRYKEERVLKFKIFPYVVDPKDSKHLSNIIKVIQNNRKYIQYPYLGQTDQIAIYGKIRRNINIEVFDTDESINIKELIKYAIAKALDLGKKDIVILLKKKYIIKIFKKNTVLNSEVNAPVKREGVSNRFNGYSLKEIEETYEEIFLKDDNVIGLFLMDVLNSVFIEDLNFRLITNEFYEKKSLSIIHAEIAKELSHYVSLEEDYILGITGYIMRENFHYIHDLLARELIECIYEKNLNANNFLLYYNGNIVLINNKKHKIPTLETEDGKQWNNASLIGICNLWMNTKKKKEEYEDKLLETNEKIQQLEKSLLCTKPENVKEIDVNSSIHRDMEFLIKKEIKLKANLRAQDLNIDSKNIQIDQILRSVSKVLMERTKNL